MKMFGAPMSYINAVLSLWMNRCPGDARGSTDVATLEELEMAVSRANCDILPLNLDL